MKIGLDVAQTCVERAGCGWTAHALSEALIRVSTRHEFVLYHHFDRWINTHTESGTHLDRAHVSSPLATLSPEKAHEIWNGVRSGAPLPGSPDIVHAFSFQAPRLPVPQVFTVHDIAFWTHPDFTTETNRLICQRGLMDALRNADGFQFVSDFSRREFERMLGGWLQDSGKPWKVILHGSRLPARDQAPEKPGDYWLFLGSLEPRKNIGAALDAIELYFAAGGKLPLHIAGGSGWKSDELKARIAALEQKGWVRRLGYVKDEDLPALFTGARGFIFPSWYEGFGLPVLEAMCMGCPVICSSTSSLPEVAGDAALYIDPAAPSTIAAGMHRLEQNEAEHRLLAEKGLARARTLTWERAARSTLSFYEDVLEYARRREHSLLPEIQPIT